MRICVVGSGYVGLVTASCLADSGNHVTAVDIDAEKVARLSRGECPIFERGLEELIRTNLKSGRLLFTTSLKEGVQGARVIFITVGTPGRPDGTADPAPVERVAGEIAAAMAGPVVLVTKSTVPVGTGERIEQIVASRTSHPFHVVSNPEFLKEGTAVDDFLRPDRVVIGAEEREAGEIVAELYRPFVRKSQPILFMSRRAAELTKYAANAYLATRISFINEIADICGRLGVDVDEVRRGMGLDSRIGLHFLYPGVGYGGSCFPKDVRALACTARQCGAGCGLLEAVDERNRAQRENLARAIIERLGPALSGRKLAIWGLAFKPNTDDVREAPAITIIERLLEAGAEVAVHDPQALQTARGALGPRVSYCPDAYEALSGADALVTCTEWMEYRNPDFDEIRRRLRQPLVFDGRNIFDPAMMRRYNFEYYSVGRPPLRPT
jgi:UDPglucose 6-dehydrogenase